MAGRPVCVKCCRFYRCKKNETAWEEGYPVTRTTWGSYRLWSGDLWECPGCGSEIIVGHGMRPVAEKHEPNYAERCEQGKPLLRVDDAA